MSVDIQVFEQTDAGPVEIDNFSLKNSSTTSVPYYSVPLRRPLLPGDQTNSFKKYIFFKITGTSATFKNAQIQITLDQGAQANLTQLFYKFSNTYTSPDTNFDGDMIFSSNNAITWFPNLGSTPELATSRPIVVTNQVVYTNYLVFQMRVNTSTWNDVGNTAQFGLALTLNEFE